MLIKFYVLHARSDSIPDRPWAVSRRAVLVDMFGRGCLPGLLAPGLACSAFSTPTWGGSAQRPLLAFGPSEPRPRPAGKVNTVDALLTLPSASGRRRPTPNQSGAGWLSRSTERSVPLQPLRTRLRTSQGDGGRKRLALSIACGGRSHLSRILNAAPKIPLDRPARGDRGPAAQAGRSGAKGGMLAPTGPVEHSTHAIAGGTK